MWAAWALIAGGVSRVLGEIVEVVGGGRTDPSTVMTALGLVLVAIGFTGLWRDAATSPFGRIGVTLVALGALGFTAIAAWSLSQGTLDIADIAQTPAFRLTAALTLLGAAGLAVWLIGSPAYPIWIGVVMCLSMALSLASSFVALPSLVQPLIDMVMALTFIQLGLSVREQRKKAKPTP
ncbi:hypothetical protein [Pelagibacterium lacus]|uniref:Uncharacterized protein n=1 Tax=Pelagibacterium lacus TaxID=2282655 RepID=A0A369W6K4_9HYPH|nr:hypothetical protein [Pelagibacterium lacus]RDE09667.1 hypothetical protein DVH29_05790 [Pelagibacterium lacus]